MPTFLKNFLKNKLLGGSLILFIGTGIANFINYLFHLLMGRMLGPIDYGILASLISLISLLGIPFSPLSLVVVKYVSTLRGKGELGMVSYFYSWISRKITIFGLSASLLLLFFSSWISSFVHLQSNLLVVLIIFFNLIGVFQIVPGATLQAFLRFGLISGLGIINTVLKLGIAVLLVLVGGRVFGAVFALLVSSLVGYFLMVFSVRRLLVKPAIGDGIETGEIIKYAIPVFFSTVAFTSLYTSDVLLVRHFLSAQEAGFYAALSTLGKIIFFAAGPVISVMFPLISEYHANGKKYLNLLTLSLCLVLAICLVISLIYFLFPKVMVNLLFGSQYLSAAPYLYLFALFLSLYSLSSLFTNFYLSVKKIKVVILPVIAALAQVIFIFLFHQSLAGLIWVSIIVLSLLFVGLLVYFFLSYGKEAFVIRHRSRV
jgi:O-antigen/teichoic acid export membrane protein